VHIFLTFLSALPETTGLLIVGSALMLAGMVLRRVFLAYETSPGHGQDAQVGDQSLK
jgi:hypothetical protein